MAAIDQRISVIGLGYVDLPVATTFARSGNPVVAFDINARRFRRPNSNSRTGIAFRGRLLPRRQDTHFRSPQAKKAALEKAGTLNARGVAEALRRDLGKAVPELRRIRQTVNERSAADRAGNLGVCLRHYRPTHDEAKETRCRSTPPG